MKKSEQSTVVAALTEEQVARITGLSKGQLRAWDTRGFFQPRYAYDDRKSAYSRIYSFKDAVGLKTIQTLKSQYRIGFKKLEEVAEELRTRGYEHWADTKLYVVKKKVHFHDPRTNQVESLEDGQFAMLPIIDVIEDVTEKVVALKARNSSKVGHIERNKFVARNSWVVAGTRIHTAAIRRYREAGFSISQILDEYPALRREDVEAALDHEKGLAKSA